MKRTYGILFGLIIVLGVAAYLVLQLPGESSVQSSGEKRLVTYDSASVDKIEMHTKSSHVVLEKHAGKWMMVEPIQFKADEAEAITAVGKGASILVSSIVSSNPQKQPVFQLDSTATLVRVFEKGNERAAFRVGKAGSSFNETYVRVDGSNDVYLATDVLSFIFAKPAKDWRDKTIFKIEKAEIKGARFHYGDTTFALTKQDTTWQLDGTPLPGTATEAFLTSLSNFMTDEFIDSAVAVPPRLVCTIEVAGVQLRFHFNKDSGKYLVQTSGSPQWFEIQSWRATQVLKRKKDFMQSVS